MSAVTLRKAEGQYDVLLDGRVIGNVYRARFRTDRYAHSESLVRGQGRWRWCASTFSDEDFATRREAVAELVCRAGAKRDLRAGVSSPDAG